MAQRIINIGSSANKGDGDPIRTAFSKANDNFTELYGKVTVLEDGTVAQVQDTKGSIFADDSTLLVDAINGIIPASVVSGTLNNNTVGTHTGPVDGDLVGSVFADNSTLLVDGVSGTIPAANLTGALPAIDGSALTGITATETDPVVGAITGIVKADGAGNISAAVAGTDYLTSVIQDTTPQLGGDLETNDKNIYFADSQDHDWGAGNADNTLFFGAGGDLRMWVPLYGSIAYIQSFNSHSIRIRGDNGIQFQVSGGYQLLNLGTDLNVSIGRAGQTITLTGNVDHGYVVENNIRTSETGSGSDKTLDTVDETVYLGAKYEVMFVTGSVVNYVEFFANLIEDEIVGIGPEGGIGVINAGDLYDYTSFAVGGTSGAKTVIWQINGGVSGTVTATAKVKYYKA